LEKGRTLSNLGALPAKTIFCYHQDMKTAQNNYAFIDAANLFYGENCQRNPAIRRRSFSGF
jgi:hypothetical protein